MKVTSVIISPIKFNEVEKVRFRRQIVCRKMLKMIWGIALLSCLFTDNIFGEDNFQVLSDANNLFALDFYKEFAKSGGNVLCSPLSAHTALSMLYQGASGGTKTAFESTLHISDKDLVAVAYNNLISRYDSISDVNVILANKLYVQNGYKLNEAFRAALKEKYDSNVEEISFENALDAMNTINEFISSKTDNKITDIFTPDDFVDRIILVLLNTLYFRGKWDVPFLPEENTYAGRFYVSDTSTVEAKFMKAQEVYMGTYDSELKAKVLEMAFLNKNFSMIAILPDGVNGITELERKLTYEQLKRVIGSLHKVYIGLRFPKFGIEQHINLKDPLTKMGLGIIFDPKCDLSGISADADLYVSKAAQKVHINVNEVGCEAAVATKFSLLEKVLVQTWKFDHPFLFFIIEKIPSGFNILFSGRLMDPSM